MIVAPKALLRKVGDLVLDIEVEAAPSSHPSMSATWVSFLTPPSLSNPTSNLSPNLPSWDRASCVTAPTLWNSLPAKLHLLTASKNSNTTCSLRPFASVKGIVHPNMIIHSFSTLFYADREVGEVFETTKHCWTFRGKQCSSQVAAESNTTEDIRGLSSDVKKQQKKNITCLHTAPVVSPLAPKFVFDSKLGNLISDEVQSGTVRNAGLATSGGLLRVKHSGNYLISSRIWMSGLADTWMTPQKPCLNKADPCTHFSRCAL